MGRYRVSYTSARGHTEEKEVEKDKNVTALAGLKPGTEYIIYIWAEKREQQSKRASSEAVTGKWAIDFVEYKLKPSFALTLRMSILSLTAEGDSGLTDQVFRLVHLAVKPIQHHHRDILITCRYYKWAVL